MFTLEVDNENTKMIWVDELGNKHSKSIDLAEFSNMLGSNVAHDFGLLPSGVRYLAQKAQNTVVAIDMPSQVIDLHFNEIKIPHVSLPPALFLFYLMKKPEGFTVTASKLYAMRNESVILSMDTLYKYPLPNVYDDCRICWGNSINATRGLKSLAALGGLARRFFNAPFNHDLFGTGALNSEFPWKEVGTSSHETLAKNYFNYLSGTTFDRNWLKPIDESQNTFTKAIKAFSGGVENDR